jgi:hypothetical protein
MISDILIAPSLNSLFVTGFLLLFILFIFISNYKQFMRFDFYRKINILLLLVIAVGVHGLVHLGLESVYGFNPYRWI